MGVSSSKFAKGPSSIATPFDSQWDVSEEQARKWKSFDYVIVGGGAAGCVLASRLSADPNVTVLLLEAGKSHEDNFYARIPLAFLQLLKSPANWAFSTTPQKALDERTVHWPRGRILGGTSTINALIYHHSDPEDFNAWEQRGATGWGYESLKKYFDRVSKDGPRTRPETAIAPVSSAALEAMKNMGITPRSDFNTDKGTAGSGKFLAAVDSSRKRSSAATAYLTPEVVRRKNLTVAVSTYTERVIFSSKAGSTPVAVGVQISSGPSSPKYAVAATKEVIVSGGVIGSPHLLQLSGVGPASLLQKHNVPVVSDVPGVGWGLLDHVSAGSLVLRARGGQTLDAYTQNPLRGAQALLQWMTTGNGPMSTLGAQVAAFTRFDDKNLPYGPDPGPVKDLSSGPTAPDLEIILFPVAVTNYGYDVPSRGNYGISVGSIVLKPASSGTVELSSNSVYDPPNIDPNYLSDESDMNALIKATRLILRLARTPPLSDVLDLRNLPARPENPDFYWIGDADPDKVSDDEIRAWIRKHAQSAWHPLSSARMGTDPQTSAVDLELRVHGVQRLRVVDGSVFPDQLSGHPWIPILAVAERAADLIRGTT